jgi:hypothetical protein
MAVDGIASGAGVLTRDAAGFRALLQEASLIDDQYTARVIPKVLNNVVAQIVPYPIDIPRRSIQEALHTLCAELTDRLGELPAVLALDAIKQTGEILSGAFAYLDPRETTGDPPIQRIQSIGPSRDGIRSAAYLFCDHASLLSYVREG